VKFGVQAVIAFVHGDVHAKHDRTMEVAAVGGNLDDAGAGHCIGNVPEDFGPGAFPPKLGSGCVPALSRRDFGHGFGHWIQVKAGSIARNPYRSTEGQVASWISSTEAPQEQKKAPGPHLRPGAKEVRCGDVIGR
jgi:hypothetical protein